MELEDDISAARERLEKIQKGHGSGRDAAETLQRLAELLENAEQYEAASDNYTEAIEQFAEYNDTEAVARLLNTQANMRYRQKKYDEVCRCRFL